MTKMFDFVDKIRPNPIGGKCYECTFCYIHGKKGMKNRFPNMKKKYNGEFKIYPSVFNINLNNVSKPMFFCDCIDWLHECMNTSILNRMIRWFKQHPNVEFLSLTRNPKAYHEIMYLLPKNFIFGITIESNCDYIGLSKAPSQSERIKQALQLRDHLNDLDMNNKIFISIEPIMKFDLLPFLDIIIRIDPTFGVAIGYDNHKHKLDEPTSKETMALRNNLIIKGITVYDKTLRKAWWE